MTPVQEQLVLSVMKKVKTLPGRDLRHKWRQALATYIGYVELASHDKNVRPKVAEFEELLKVFIGQSKPEQS
jgi:hypothetical protein